MTPIIQAAGVHDPDEALLLASAGFTHIGFPLRLDVHAEDVDPTGAAAITRVLRERTSVVPFVITYLVEPAEIAALCGEVGVTSVQLHGEPDPDEVRRLRELVPDLQITKSLVVGADAEARLTAAVAAFGAVVDGFVTDTFDPATGARGATGLTHDWAVSRRLVRTARNPLILAGGLAPENVGAAIWDVRPAGVDVHTGIEDERGRKDAALAQLFVGAARAAFAMV